jgi:hypothetical protein
MSASIVPTPFIQAIVADLVSAEHWPDGSFVRLPMVYPGGSLVTVKIDQLTGNRYRVSDAGFGFREIEEIGAQRSFTRIANALAEEAALGRNARAFFIEVPADQLSRAISDVGMASWQVVDRIYASRRDEDEEEIVEHLAERLEIIFGSEAVEQEATLIGASTTPWGVTAIVKKDDRVVAFQAVSAYANSIYRANAAFDDLSALDNPPGLVAVVHSKIALGPRLTLLARSARIVEEEQPDSAFLRAAAW